MKSTQHTSSQKGQALIIISLGMVTLLALVAVVLDAGNDYVQRRQLQNSMDAAAQAGGLKIAIDNSTNGDVLDAVTAYAGNNGTDVHQVKAYYVVQDNSGNNIVVRSGTIDTYGRSNRVPQTLTVSGSSYPVVGVQIEGNRTFNTFLAGVVGFPQLQVNGGSAAYANKGACSASGLLPMTMNISVFKDENGDGIRDVHYEQTDPSYTYSIFEKDAGQQNAPGNFGWLTWHDGDVSANSLAANIQDTSRSGKWSVGDNIPGSTGTMASSQARQNLQWYVDNNVPVIIPIFDTVSGTGSNAKYHIIAFARIHMVSIDLSGNPKVILGKFQEWVDPNADGGCTNVGVVSVKIRPPIDVTRTLIGTVKIQKLTILGRISQSSQHVPVDVVNVMDTSASMSSPFGGGSSKMTAAKNALNHFGQSLQPSNGDQIGLASFPLIQSGSSYSYSCTHSGSSTSYYLGNVQSTLINKPSSLNNVYNSLTPNGETPLAAGLLQGRQTVLGTNHSAGNIPILVVASDGHANIRLNGQWTGFSDGAYDTVNCNSSAQQDALDQANIAKSDANGDGLPDVIIYGVAIGNDFNSALLQALATPDTDPARPHYFLATDSSSLDNVYTQIGTLVQSIYNECRVISSEAYAANATVSIRFPDGSTRNVQASSDGSFVLNNLDSGTYQITNASVTINGVTYNVPTNGVGGPAVSYPINVTVGTSNGTYSTDFALRNSGSLSCNQ